VTAKLLRNAYEAALTMTAVLLCWSAALVLEATAHLHTDVLVLAVALSLTLSSTQRTADTRRRLTALVLLPATAAVAQLVGRLIATHYAAARPSSRPGSRSRSGSAATARPPPSWAP
jgi:hypothetical protein